MDAAVHSQQPPNSETAIVYCIVYRTFKGKVEKFSVLYELLDTIQFNC